MIKNTVAARTIFAAICAFAVLTLPAVATAEPTEIFGEPSSVEKFGDWVAGCAGDEGNKWQCTGVALIPENSTDPKTTVMQLKRHNSSHFRISFPSIVNPEGGYQIKIDDRLVFSRGKDKYYTVGKKIQIFSGYGVENERRKPYYHLINQIARGKNLVVYDKQQNILGSVSLKGSTASMRYMDDQQNLSGYQNAFLRRGNKKRPSLLSAGPRTMRGSNIKSILPKGEELSEILEADMCGEKLSLGEDHEIHALPIDKFALELFDSRLLILADCGNDEFGKLSRAVIALHNSRTDEWTAAPAKYETKWGSDLTEVLSILHSPELSISNHIFTLKSTKTPDGQTDCGIRQTFTYDGGYTLNRSSFSPSQRYEMPVCGGDTEWIRVE